MSTTNKDKHGFFRPGRERRSPRPLTAAALLAAADRRALDQAYLAGQYHDRARFEPWARAYAGGRFYAALAAEYDQGGLAPRRE